MSRILRAGIVVAAAAGLWYLVTLLFGPATTEPIDSYQACANAGYEIAYTQPPVCDDGVGAFTGPNASPAPTGAPLTAQQFQLLVDGDSHGNYPQAQRLVTSPSEFTAYWGQVHASLASIPPILPVDFNNSDVIALTEGPKPTSGYDFTITGVMTGAAGTTVDIALTTPDLACAPPSHSDEYLIVQTPKLPMPIRYVFASRSGQC